MFVLHQAGHWGLPKGHPKDTDKSPEETARRELYEETGLMVETLLPYPPFTETYLVNGESKEVVYFAATVSGEISPQAGEIHAIKWVGVEDLEKQASFPAQKDLLSKISRALLEG